MIHCLSGRLRLFPGLSLTSYQPSQRTSMQSTPVPSWGPAPRVWASAPSPHSPWQPCKQILSWELLVGTYFCPLFSPHLLMCSPLRFQSFLSLPVRAFPSVPKCPPSQFAPQAAGPLLFSWSLQLLPMAFFTGLEWKIQNSYGNTHTHKITKAIFRKKNRAGGINLPGIKLHYKATVIKAVWY